MLVVDSSVWIDFFAGRPNPARDVLRGLLRQGEVRIVVPDLVYFEVLRGFRDERGFRGARALLQGFGIEAVCGEAMAHTAALHYRDLRARGFTVRSGIDVLIASFCIERDYRLLHRDRDFTAFESFRGLSAWQH